MYFARTPERVHCNFLLDEWIDYICVKNGLLMIDQTDFRTHAVDNILNKHFSGISLNNIEFAKNYKDAMLYHVNNALKYQKPHPIFPNIRKELIKNMTRTRKELESYIDKTKIDNNESGYVSMLSVDQHNKAVITKQLLDDFINGDVIIDPVQAKAHVLSMKEKLTSLPPESKKISY